MFIKICGYAAVKYMNKCVKAVLFAAILCFIPFEAFAYRVGQVDVTLRGGVSEVYDDNITFVKTNRLSGFVTRPTIGAVAAYEGKGTVISAAGNYYHEFYADRPAFNNNGGDFTAAIDSELSKFDRITLSDTFTRTYEPRSFEDQFGRTSGRYSSTRNRVNFGYARDVSQHFGLSLRYSNEYNTYSRADIAESFLNTAGVEGAYVLRSDMSFIGAYDFTRRDFDSGADTYTNTLSGGLRKYFTKQLYFDGMGGVDLIKSYSGRSYTKMMAIVSLTDDINDRTRATLSFSKRYDTISYSQDLFDQWRVSAGLIHELFKKLKGVLSAFYGRGEYTGTGVVNKLMGSSVGLTYDINDIWKASAGYSFSREALTGAAGGYRKNTVTIGFTAEF